MKILHTADWHLGHYLKGQENDRSEEHEYFLGWLLEVIENYSIELLVIAGDIFDTANPPHWAEEQYYRFLAEVTRTQCKNVVIIAGNHDSPNKLNAPKELFKYMNIHVVGKVHYQRSGEVALQHEIIPIYEQKNQPPSLVVCAVPFLKDADIRKSVANESLSQTEGRVKEGILNHYHQISELITTYKNSQIPILATGHLFAAGMTSSESEKDIHIGNQGNIDANKLPQTFDYVALGHIHRPQKVANKNHIRYSGSPIPLSFSENTDRKIVLILNLNEKGLTDVQEISVPLTRPLLRLKGSLQDIESQLLKINFNQFKFAAWAEVKAVLKEYEPNLREKIHEIGNKFKIRDANMVNILSIGVEYAHRNIDTDEQALMYQSIHEIKPIEVFEKKCKSENIDIYSEKYKDILEAFKGLLEEVEKTP
ncbi:MAG: exonuclease subunit SbcD [Cytophagales bacterium]|nr:MAG: exonuclease subunit SbcD [Cytophagales bacterium]